MEKEKSKKYIVLKKCFGIIPGKPIFYSEEPFLYKKGDIIEAEDRKNGWYHIHFENRFAMLHSRFLEELLDV